MTEQERAVMQQALEALEQDNPAGRTATIAAVRAAQEQATGSWHDGVLEGQLRERERWLAQEPVATPWKAMYELAIEQRTKAHAQRDALLEALKEIVAATDSDEWNPVSTVKARAAIKMMEEGK